MNNGKKRIILGLIALAVAFAVLLGLQAVDAKLPAPAAAAAAAETEGKYTPGTYTGTADGFGGPVSVTLTVGGDGRISNVSVTGDRETPSVGGAAIPDLAEAVLSAQGGDVDVVSGATFTSNAVRTAASAAAAEAMGAAVQSGPKAADGNRYIPGTYTGSSKGFGGDITVTVTVDENSILDVNIDGSHETENIGSLADTKIGTLVAPINAGDVVGTVEYKVGDSVLFTSNLYADRDVKEGILTNDPVEPEVSVVQQPQVSVGAPLMGTASTLTGEPVKESNLKTILLIVLGALFAVVLIAFVAFMIVVRIRRERRRKARAAARRRKQQQQQRIARQRAAERERER